MSDTRKVTLRFNQTRTYEKTFDLTPEHAHRLKRMVANGADRPLGSCARPCDFGLEDDDCWFDSDGPVEAEMTEDGEGVDLSEFKDEKLGFADLPAFCTQGFGVQDGRAWDPEGASS